MAVTDFFAGEIVTELLRNLILISRKACLCKSSAEHLISYINQLLPIIQEIKYIGVELKEIRQLQLDELSETLRRGLELSQKVLASPRWSLYKNLHYSRKMEKLEKTINRFLKGPFQGHILADVHHIRFENTERFDRLEGLLEKRLGALRIGVGSGSGSGSGGSEGIGWIEEAARRVEEDEMVKWEGNLVSLGLDLGKKKVKEMIIGREDLGVVGICGIGGSGKTTLARVLCKDDEVRKYFGDRILFLTISQSPNLEQLKATVWGFIMGNENLGPNTIVPQWNWNPQHDWRRNKVRTLIVLDDVWSLAVLQSLILKIPGCKTLVVSRFKFPEVCSASYEVELLREEEAVSLFCHSAFGQISIPPIANANLVKQIVSECKGLPLALKVIGASLRGQTEMFWASAKNKLSRGEPIGESHANNLLERMAISVNCLSGKVRECFLDLGAFPEDEKIPVDVLINMWTEIHDIDELDVFAILTELSNKNLLTLENQRDGNIYSSFYDISVTQHDVLRDLAIHLSNCDSVRDRKRLSMPRREMGLPKEWERNADKPFNAQIVSIHTGEMSEMDWFQMEFPKAEVLILNFSSSEYFLPPFMENMPMLKALIVTHYGSGSSTLRNFSVFSSLANLRSLWLKKVIVPQIFSSSILLKRLMKLSLVLCSINKCVDTMVDLVHCFPGLSELTIDHCDDLFELSSCICCMRSLKILSITNCHSLFQLPADIGKLKSLQILRLYACPALKVLPPSICDLISLEYIDISQCVNLSSLPMGIGKFTSLVKIDMRECSHIRKLPKSAVSLKSLRQVICDEELNWLWKDVEEALPSLHVQVAEKYFNLDWLDE